MSKQKRHVLSLETTEDFELIGICSHHSDYRLAWSLNNLLSIQLAKSDELFVIQSKKGAIVSQHSYHLFVDMDHVEWYLIKNKAEGKFLLPEKNQIDYFLILRNNILLELEDVLEKLRASNSVMAAYIFEPSSIPSTELIVFE